MKIAAFHSPGLPFRMFGFLQGANVLSTKTGIIKLADFGVATKLSEIDSSKRRVVGTPYWMAPETVETFGGNHGGLPWKTWGNPGICLLHTHGKSLKVVAGSWVSKFPNWPTSWDESPLQVQKSDGKIIPYNYEVWSHKIRMIRIRARVSVYLFDLHMSLCRFAHILYVSRSCQPQLNKLWLIYMAGLAENQTTICCFHDPPPVNSEFTEFQYNLSFVPGTSLPAFVSRKKTNIKTDQDIKDQKKNVDEIPTLGWWFGTCFIFPNSWDDDPIWLIFVQGVKTTKQYLFCISNPIGPSSTSCPGSVHPLRPATFGVWVLQRLERKRLVWLVEAKRATDFWQFNAFHRFMLVNASKMFIDVWYFYCSNSSTWLLETCKEFYSATLFGVLRKGL